MNSKDIRKKFLNFFLQKQHHHVSQSPIVNNDDPSLMFTNAGMNQFKNYFLGNKKIDLLRVVNTQPCLRVSGKHNDLEEVGLDTYHHTLFEMLGNWSFGNYFKKESINWAWELLTNVFNIPKERIYITIFGGDEGEKLSADQESYKIWSSIVDENQIMFFSKKDNFWEMGSIGPCGPSTEIHVDNRPDNERKKINARELINKNHPQVIEIWNLVFIQYSRLASSKLVPLKKFHVDTGMGLERLAMILQKKKSTYDTDIFKEIIEHICKKSKIVYGDNFKKDIAIRVIADHIRPIVLTIGEGHIPSNTKAGYVIRRILRRAIRYAYSYLNLEAPFLFELVPLVVKYFKEIIPDISTQIIFIQTIIKEEEKSFLHTLSNGLLRIEQMIKQYKVINGQQLKDNNIFSGECVFELYDTYGFPPDLTKLILKEKGYIINDNDFTSKMNEQKNRSKKAVEIKAGDWLIIKANCVSKFVGYDSLISKSKVIKYQQIERKGDKYYKVIFDNTPCYAEGGGQIGDTGYIQQGAQRIEIIDTKKENDTSVHIINKLPNKIYEYVTITVDKNKRKLIEINHSTTHLLHAALKIVLGKHVLQKGSLVNDKFLRFDFSHFSKISNDQLQEIESIVNNKIRDNIDVDINSDVSLEKAKQQGATALFSEKYGEKVRTVAFDKNFSFELCGGTHIKNTVEIGFFKIISQCSIASGVRRIEAVTATGAQKHINKKINELSAINKLLGFPQDNLKKISSILQANKELSKENSELLLREQNNIKKSILLSQKKMKNLNIIIKKIKLPKSKLLKNITYDLHQSYSNLFLVLAADVCGKPYVSVALNKEVIKKTGEDAKNIIQKISKFIDGKGGGQPGLAIAGGSNIDGLQKVLEYANEFVDSVIYE